MMKNPDDDIDDDDDDDNDGNDYDDDEEVEKWSQVWLLLRLSPHSYHDFSTQMH